jgi:hypothetical protein
MSKEYKEYLKLCDELGVAPHPEFTPIQVNRGVLKWGFIVVAIMVNLIASIMAAIVKSKR